MLFPTTDILLTPHTKCLLALAVLMAAASSSSAWAFEQQSEHKVDATTVWGINVTRGVRLSSQQATNFMTINSRDAHLNNTVAPRIPMIQSNRELLRTMPTCFDPNDPARISWYGNVEENVSGGSGSGGGNLTDKSAWWKYTVSIKTAPNVNGYPRFSTVKAYFSSLSSTITMGGGYSLYPEGDPAADACDDSNPCYVYTYSFESSDPSLSIQSACAIPGVSFTRTSGLYPQARFDHKPTCANGMYLEALLSQTWGCLLDIENQDIYCMPELGGTYTITAHWQEGTQDPPPPSGTVTNTPVIYDYDPRTCSSIP